MVCRRLPSLRIAAPALLHRPLQIAGVSERAELPQRPGVEQPGIILGMAHIIRPRAVHHIHHQIAVDLRPQRDHKAFAPIRPLFGKIVDIPHGKLLPQSCMSLLNGNRFRQQHGDALRKNAFLHRDPPGFSF
ncbi:hypothetical protein D3C75_1012170 [compost metagenome]